MAFNFPTYRITNENVTGGASGKAVNVMHWTSGSTGTASDATLNLVLAEIKALYTAVAPYLFGTWQIGTRVLELLGSGPPLIRNVAAVTQAMSGSVIQPQQLAAVVSWRTQFAGPAYRGRTFLGPLTGSALSSGALITGLVNAANTAATNMITALQAHGSASGLVVRSNVKETDSLVISGFMNSKVDTLRRRS